MENVPPEIAGHGNDTTLDDQNRLTVFTGGNRFSVHINGKVFPVICNDLITIKIIQQGDGLTS